MSKHISNGFLLVCNSNIVCNNCMQEQGDNSNVKNIDHRVLGYTKVCNHPQPSTTTQKLLKNTKTCHQQWRYSTLDVNTETDVEF